MQYLKQYYPVLGMVLATVLQALIAVVDGGVTAGEALVVILALTGALSTYVVPSLAQFPWVKTVVSAITAAVVVVSDAVTSGGKVDTSVILSAAVAFIFGLGVVAATEKYTPKHNVGGGGSVAA